MNDYRIVITNGRGQRTQLTVRPTQHATETWLTWLTGVEAVRIDVYNDLDSLVGQSDFGATSIAWRRA